MTQEELNALVNEFYEYLANQKDFYEVWPSEDDTICVDVDWGDWKHDHLRLDHVAREFFENKGYDVLNMNTEVTDEDGSDTYSATHSYRLRKHEEEPKEYKMVDSNSVKVEEESLCEEDNKDVSKVRLENPRLVSWPEYYLNDVCDGDVDEYNELYADSMDDFGDEPCQFFFDVLDDKDNYLGKIGIYLFEGMGMWYEIGFEPNAKYLDIEKLDLEDMDLPVDGWFPEEHVVKNDDDLLKTEEQAREYLVSYLAKIENAIEYSNDDLED